MFQQPSQGDQVKVAELLGSLVLIWVKEYREDIATTFGPADAVACDIHVLDGPKGGEEFENTLVFQKALIGSLRPAAGGEPVLGRISQGVAKPNQSPPYILSPFSDADAALATRHIQQLGKPFQAPNGSQAAPAATQTATAALPGGMTREAFDALPKEVQELLRQQAGDTPPF